MKKILLLLLCFQAVINAQSGQKNFIDQPYIEVYGNGTMEVIPNEIYISITLQETDKSAKKSIESQENNLKTLLKKAGINSTKNLTVKDFTTSYNNYFIFKPDLRKTKEFELLVANGKELNTVYGILESLKIANSYIIRVDHSDIEKLKLQANIKAITDAKNKSNSYTNALEQKTGKAIYIREQSQIVQGYSPLRESMSYSSKISSSSKQVHPASEINNIIIKASVLARFTII